MFRALYSVVLLTLCFVLPCGCDRANTTSKPANISSDVNDSETAESESIDPGPNGGTIVEWGGGVFLAELIVDRKSGEATVYLFGNDAKTPMPIGSKSIILAIRDPSVAIELTPKPLGSEILGNASRFVGSHEYLTQPGKLSGAISGVIGKTPYSGNFTKQ